MGQLTSVHPDTPTKCTKLFELLSLEFFTHGMQNINYIEVLKLLYHLPPFSVLPAQLCHLTVENDMNSISKIKTTKKVPGTSRDVMVDQISLRSNDIVCHFPDKILILGGIWRFQIKFQVWSVEELHTFSRVRSLALTE